ncbi:DNA translocase FtsK [Pontibacillus yanchengensis]|uniref:DNA translocase FtsK n=1 Tax=Pontibacillus yanchengensis TaxID=462910 RepID=UPI001F248AEC|nr:DNA translocase FtsK [Pontibacillus yanchengensis]
MKKWIHQMREQEEDWDEQEQNQPSPQTQGQSRNQSNSDIKTKMYYQYPSQGSFKFPVIPDDQQRKQQHNRQKQNNHVLDQKSDGRSNSYTSQSSNSYSSTKKDSYTWSSKESTNYSSKSVKEDIQPSTFTPSEVPSPIYGFGKREGQIMETDIDEVPAYFRKASQHEEDLTKPDSITTNVNLDHSEVFQDFEESEDFQEEANDNVVSLFESSLTEDGQEDDIQNDDQSNNEQHDEELHESFVSLNDKNDDYVNQEDGVEDDRNYGSNALTLDTDIDEEIEEAATEIDKDELEDTKILQEEVESQDTQPEHYSETEDEVEEEKDFVAVQEESEARHSRNGVQESASNELENKTVGKTEVEPASKKHKRPFNVIMTPRDKRNRDRQQSAEKERQKKTEETAAHSKGEVENEQHDQRKDSTPPMHLLNDSPKKNENDQEWIEQQKELLETTLRHFHVKAKVVNAMKGPAVTRFEVQPEPGVKVSKITNLSDDIKLNMAAKDIRMEAPIPGKNAIGIEVPNPESQAVALQEILESPDFVEHESPLSVGLGLDISGTPVVTDLRKMPHGLIAGATGSGKSVCINTILLSLLYKSHHEDVKFLLIDPKMVELAPYNDLPHLVAPVITNIKAATSALKWAVKEMESRYEKFVAEGVRDIDRYNDKVKAKGRPEDKMSYLVIVIDELADLMMMSPQDVEDAICRIAQKARACGMHLLLATQRPSVDVITGLIKANIPTRTAFSVSSQIDSRTILDAGGAEKLLGKGDMLFLENGSGKTRRVQGAFVSDDEIERVTNYVKKIASPQYEFEQEELIQQMDFEESEDDLFEEAVEYVIEQNGASASLIQRRFKVGYNRAARLIDTMEEKGIISEAKGSKPRDVFMNWASFEEMRQNNE